MKKELYSHFIYLSNFFKTTELKISTNDNLEVNEISALGSVHYKIDLTDAYLKIKDTQQKKYNGLLISLLLLAAGITPVIQFSLTNHSLIFPLLSCSLILSSALLLLLKTKAKKVCSLYKSSNNQFIYKFCLDMKSSNSDNINKFIHELTRRISKDNTLESVVETTSQNSTEDQYNHLMYNLECLYNAAVIDDITFDKIDARINEKLYPKENRETQYLAEVIYLHKNLS